MRHVAAGLALVALSVLTACAPDRPDGTRIEGPVVFLADPEARQAAFTHADRGATVVFGALAVENQGDAPAVLTSAALTGTEGTVAADGARVREVRVRDVTGGRDLVGAGRWPADGYADESVPLAGYRLEPERTAELLFVVVVDETGHWTWPQTQLDYESGTESYTIRVSTGFGICPRAATDCDPLR